MTKDSKKLQYSTPFVWDKYPAKSHHGPPYPNQTASFRVSWKASLIVLSCRILAFVMVVPCCTVPSRSILGLFSLLRGLWSCNPISSPKELQRSHELPPPMSSAERKSIYKEKCGGETGMQLTDVKMKRIRQFDTIYRQVLNF